MEIKLSSPVGKVEVTVYFRETAWAQALIGLSGNSEALEVHMRLFEETLRDALKPLVLTLEAALNRPRNGLLRVESLGLGVLKAKLDCDALDKLTSKV